MRLNERAFGFALGILWGATIFIATLWVALIGGGETLYKLRQFYPGYSISLFGALVGFVYALIHGFIWGWLFAWLYNRSAKV